MRSFVWLLVTVVDKNFLDVSIHAKADGAVTIPLGVIPIQPRWMPCKFGIILINQLIL